MDKQLLKRGSIVVASAIAIFGLSVASPSMASTGKNHNPVVKVAAKKAAATPTPAPTAGGNLAWGNNGAGAGQGDDQGFEDGDHAQGGDHGKGDHGKRGDHGKGPKGAPANLTDQTVTVDVPADSAVYVAVITEVRAPVTPPATGSVATPPAPPAHTETVPVVGVGSQTITFKGIAGQAYTVQLVKVVSTQAYTGK